MSRRLLIALTIFALVFAGLGLLGCDSSAVRLGPSDELGVVQLGVGERLDVELPSELSTEYEWVVAQSPGSLKRRGRTEYRRSSGQAGAGGTETITFEAVSPGQGSLTLEYRSTLSEARARDTYRVGVVVTE